MFVFGNQICAAYVDIGRIRESYRLNRLLVERARVSTVRLIWKNARLLLETKADIAILKEPLILNVMPR